MLCSDEIESRFNDKNRRTSENLISVFFCTHDGLSLSYPNWLSRYSLAKLCNFLAAEIETPLRRERKIRS